MVGDGRCLNKPPPATAAGYNGPIPLPPGYPEHPESTAVPLTPSFHGMSIWNCVLVVGSYGVIGVTDGATIVAHAAKPVTSLTTSL